MNKHMINGDESHKCNEEWKKPYLKQYIVYNFICIKYENKQNRRMVTHGEEA